MTGRTRNPWQREVARLQRAIAALHRRYHTSARGLPWRQTTDPYAIWVSEVMLQQTQVATVIPYFARWMAAFPTVRALAAAPERRILRLWQGLGYYARARHLHRAAQILVQTEGGRIPADAKRLAELPGIGPYTQAAVLSIAFAQPYAVVDGNVGRVLGRLLALAPPHTTAASVRALAQALLGSGPPALHNQAIMELGATVCTPRSPRCSLCPLTRVCIAHHQGAVERYPLRPPKRIVPHKHHTVAVISHRGRLLFEQRPYGGMLAGLWDLPLLPVETANGAFAEEEALRLARPLAERYER